MSHHNVRLVTIDDRRPSVGEKVDDECLRRVPYRRRVGAHSDLLIGWQLDAHP